MAKTQTLPTVPIYTFAATDGANSGYDAVGNLTAYTDSVTGSWGMQYDNLNRLGTASSTGGYYNGINLQWGYDSFGNRLSQTPSGGNVPVPAAISMTYDQNNRIATSSVPGLGGASSYDGAGNLIFDGTDSIAYDAENRVCAVSNSGVVTQYLYDAEGQRVAKGHSASGAGLVCPIPGDFQPTEKYIIGQSGEQITELDGSNQWQHSNVYANGQLLATYDNEGSLKPLHFYIGDPLGTKRVQASATGVVELNCRSLPYDDGLDCEGAGQDATEHHFTGKERDAESGLDYFGARYYASSMGRFLSPDYDDQPVGLPFGDLSEPQKLNLYSYVRNNPLVLRDLNGHVPCSGSATVTITVTPNGSSMSQSPDDCPNGNGPAWWDFPGWAFTGLGNMMLKGHEAQGAKQMAYGYAGEAAAGAAGGAGGLALRGLGWVGGLLADTSLGWTRVGRWMSTEELEAMKATGRVQAPLNGSDVSFVANPANPAAYPSAAPGSVYVEFDVPEGSLTKGDQEGWSRIPGPNSLEGRLARMKGLDPPELPEAKNIQVKDTK